MPKEDVADFIGLSCEFNEWCASIKFDDVVLFTTENDSREYYEDSDEYEDLEHCIIRILLKKFAIY